MMTNLEQLTENRIQIETALGAEELETIDSLADQRWVLLQAMLSDVPESQRQQFVTELGPEIAWTQQMIENFERHKRELQGRINKMKQQKSAASAYERAG